MSTSPEIKTAVRFPAETHKRLAALSDLTKVSQNTIIIEAVNAICLMAEDEANWVVPDIAVQARAIIDHNTRPFRFAPPQRAVTYRTMIAAEDPPGANRTA